LFVSNSFSFFIFLISFLPLPFFSFPNLFRSFLPHPYLTFYLLYSCVPNCACTLCYGIWHDCRSMKNWVQAMSVTRKLLPTWLDVRPPPPPPPVTLKFLTLQLGFKLYHRSFPTFLSRRVCLFILFWPTDICKEFQIERI
jgi:hypothetical protein